MILERLCLAVLYGSAVGAVATSLGAPFAWVFLVPAAVSLSWRWRRASSFWISAGRRLLWILIAVTFVLGWIAMAYPVLSPSTIRSVSLVVGLGLALVGGLFLLGSSIGSPARTFLPATIGLLVVASLQIQAPIHPYLLAAGIAVFIYLSLGPGARVSWQRGVSLGASALLVFSIVTGIFWFLPWAQGWVEQAAVDLYLGDSSGFSSEGSSRLGELERLKLSRKVVLRMWSPRPVKLRGRVLFRFDGKRWSGKPRPSRVSPVPSLPIGDGSLRSRLNEIPGKNFVIRETDPPFSFIKVVRADAGTDVLLTPVGTQVARAEVDALFVDRSDVLTLPPLSAARLYGLVQGPDRPSVSVSNEELAACLEVPEDTDARLRELAARLARGTASPEERIGRTEEYVSTACHYSLEVGKFETDQPIAEFLFDKKRGWCEFFASAAAILLRLQDVPARYVSGFNIIPGNRVGDHFLVRESDAHAWVEAFVPDRGWIEVDPTPAAEYEALHADLGGGWRKEAWEGLKASFGELWIRLRQGDWRYLWRPVSAFLGRPWVALTLVLGLAAAVFRLVRRMWLSRRRSVLRRSPDVRPIPAELEGWMKRLDREWKQRGWPRPPTRAPLEHLKGLSSEQLSPDLWRTARQLVQCYYRAAFRGEQIGKEDMASLRKSVARCLGR